MGKINLGRERGVQPTNSAQHGATSSRGYDLLSGGYERLGRGVMSVAEGIDSVGDMLTKIYNDQSESRNRQEFLEGQTQFYNISQAKVKEIEERMERGEFDKVGGLEALRNATLKADSDIEREFGQWAKSNITQLGTRNNLMEHKRLETKKLFAQISGSFIAHDRKRRWNMYDKQSGEAIERLDIGALNMVLDAYCVNIKNKEVEDSIRRDAYLKFAIKKAESVAKIENDADRQVAIDSQREAYTKALEGSSTEVFPFLTSSDNKYILGYLSDIKAKSEEVVAKRYKESLGDRFAILTASKGKERELREKNFREFVSGCKYFSDADKARAIGALDKFLNAEKAGQLKAEEEAKKLAIQNFKTETVNLVSGLREYSDEENAIIQAIRNGITGKLNNGKEGLIEKQKGLLEFVQDAVDSYDADADANGVYGRNLFYLIESAFTEDKESNLINNPQAKERVLRELKERLGIFPNVNIKAEEVKPYFENILLSALDNDKIKDLDLNNTKKQYLIEIKQAFIRKAMTSGLNDSNELGRWVESSPYVNDVRAKIKALYSLGKEEVKFDMSWAYTGGRTKGTESVVGDIFSNMNLGRLENAYRNSEANRNEKISKVFDKE